MKYFIIEFFIFFVPAMAIMTKNIKVSDWQYWVVFVSLLVANLIGFIQGFNRAIEQFKKYWKK